MQASNNWKRGREIFLLGILTTKPKTARCQSIDTNIYLVYYLCNNVTMLRSFWNFEANHLYKINMNLREY